MRFKKVVVECYPDEILARTLGINKREIVHQNCKGEVCNYLSKNDVVIAIVDEDPKSSQPKCLNSFHEIEDYSNVRKLVNQKDSKVILVIKPRLEEWVIDQCKLSNVKPEKFFLPNNAKDLKKVINIQLGRFSNLLSELMKVENKGLIYLQNEIENANK